MRHLTLCGLLCLCCVACNDDDAHVDPNALPDSGLVSRDKDAGAKPAGDASSETACDGGRAPSTSALRPALPRLSSGLPAELRPPR